MQQIPDFIANQTPNPLMGTDPIRVLSDEIGPWARYNFPDSQANPDHNALGLAEEWGELVKAERTVDPTEIEDAVGDVMVYSADMCAKLGLNFASIVADAKNQDSLCDLGDHVREVMDSARSALAIESIGMICHHQLKTVQGIRGTREEHTFATQHRLTNLIVALIWVCDEHVVNLDNCVRTAWSKVRLRDWQKKKRDGVS